MEEISTKLITKLDQKNYQVWKFQIRNLLIANGVYDLITGERILPDDTEENAMFKSRWIKDNAKAMVLISTTIKEEQLESLLTCANAKEMWDQLSIIHEQKSASNKLILTQRFHEYRMNSGDSVVQHVAKIRNMASALSDLGEQVSDVAIMAKILASLPFKFNALKTAWDSVDVRNQTLDNLLERLIKEENRLTIDDETVTAFAAASLKEKQDFKKGNIKKLTRDNKYNNYKKRKEIECYYCHEKGHLKRNCFKRKLEENKRKHNDSQLEQAFIATCKDHHDNDKNEERYAEQVNALMTDDISHVWITDSGASRHITYRREWLSNFCAITNDVSVSLGDGVTYQALGSGTVHIEYFIEGEWHQGRIDNVLYIPQMKKNLFSVGICTAKGLEVCFQENQVTIKCNNRIVALGKKQNNHIYRMLFRVRSHQNEVNISVTNLQTWHERLGHINKQALLNISKTGILPEFKYKETEDLQCRSCQIGKSHRLPFNKDNIERSSKPGEFIHSDICGPMSCESLGGARYFVVFKDDASGFRHVYFIRHKSDVFDKFKEYERLIANQFGQTMKRLRVDNGREYCSTEFKQYLRSYGIRIETTAPYTPEQNGRVERDNRTLIECARTMIYNKNLPKFLWAEAVNTAAYLLNRTIINQTQKLTPYEFWMQKRPNLSHTRIFGSEAFVHIPKQFRKKLDPKAKRKILVGYQGDSANYRLYDPITKNIIVSRDVIFFERTDSESLFSENDSNEELLIPKQDELDDKPVANDNLSDVNIKNETNELNECRQLRDRSKLKPPDRYCANIAEIIIPETYQEAITCSDSTKWCTAIQEELKSHENNGTWILIPRKSNYNLIDSKWIFRIKQTTTGEIIRYKARLCARGFKQKVGTDYTETFSPVIRYDSLRVFLALVAEKDLELIQFDVKTAFLYGDLQEDIYMEIPEGIAPIHDKKIFVCKLIKSLYGLKQASRCWNKKFTNFLKKFNLTQSDAENCIFQGTIKETPVLLALYVDDGLVAAKSQEILNSIIQTMQDTFEITLGDITIFAGLQLKRNRLNKEIIIHQRAYIERMIMKFHMKEAKTLSIPADPHAILSEAEKNENCKIKVPFREAVGSLMFISTVSRPDIAFSVNSVSRYLNCYNNSHWQAVTRIFRYLLNTLNLSISYRSGGSKFEIEGFSDADYANDINTRRSTTGYIFSLAGGPVSWCSQRQSLVTLSTTEAEYVAAASAAKEAIWLRKLLKDIGYQCSNATTLYIDNQSAIKLVKNPEFHKRTKHIDVRYHFIREKVEAKELHVEYIPSNLQKADIFTKALPKDRFRFLCSSIGLCNNELNPRHLNGGSVNK